MSRSTSAQIAPLCRRLADFDPRCRAAGPIQISLRLGGQTTLLPLDAGFNITENLLLDILGGTVTDSAGQTRSIYRSLVVSTYLRYSARPHPKLAATLLKFPALPPADEFWRCWLLHLAGATEQSAELCRRAIIRQHPAGTFHPLPTDTSLDAFIYDEFVALHALANLALDTDDPALLDALRRAAVYHMENTQLENVSNQPWGLTAFAIFPETLHVAEQIENDCQVFWSGATAKVPAITWLLFQDAIRSLLTPF